MKLLPQPPVAATTNAASISTVFHVQDSIEMTDITDNSSTSAIPTMLPNPRPQPKPQQKCKVDVSPELFQHAAKKKPCRTGIPH